MLVRTGSDTAKQVLEFGVYRYMPGTIVVRCSRRRDSNAESFD